MLSIMSRIEQMMENMPSREYYYLESKYSYMCVCVCVCVAYVPIHWHTVGRGTAHNTHTEFAIGIYTQCVYNIQ